MTMRDDIIINGRAIGTSHNPSIVAALSGNHNPSIERAIQLIDAAADSGADAVKLQTYTADTMTLNCRMPGFFVDNPESLLAVRTLY